MVTNTKIVADTFTLKYVHYVFLENKFTLLLVTQFINPFDNYIKLYHGTI